MGGDDSTSFSTSIATVPTRLKRILLQSVLHLTVGDCYRWLLMSSGSSAPTNPNHQWALVCNTDAIIYDILRRLARRRDVLGASQGAQSVD